MPHLMKYSPLISINLSVNNSEISYMLLLVGFEGIARFKSCSMACADILTTAKKLFQELSKLVIFSSEFISTIII